MTFGISAEEAGLALRASLSPCRHENWEPVESGGERVATICADCLDRLPLTYGGEVSPVYVLCEYEPVAYAPLP